MSDKIKSTRIHREVYSFICPFGGTWANASRIVSKFGVSSLDELRKSPYSVGFYSGLSYEVCDLIAKSLGIITNDSERIKYGIQEALEKSKTQGNCFSYESEILRETNRLFKRTGKSEMLPSTLLMSILQKDASFVIDYDKDGGEAIYAKPMYNAECNVAKHIARLLSNSKPLNFSDDVIEWAEENCNIKYAPEQRACFELIKKTGVAIVMNFKAEEKNNKLVLCHTAGSPIEASRLDKIMKKFIKDKALPPVEFYSIRHLSITYKLKWNQGDIKSTQGDAGHSNSKMVTDVYSHILDEGRKNNADLVEANFFSKQKSDSEIPSQELSDEMLAKLFSDPESQEKLRAFLEKLDNK